MYGAIRGQVEAIRGLEPTADVDPVTIDADQLRTNLAAEFDKANTAASLQFSQDELDITVHENTLIVTGKSEKEDENGRYLHRGIARRAFERRFSLADHMKVVGATMDNGLLHVDVVREVPEAMKPRQIKIGTVENAQPTKIVEQKAA